MTINKSFKKKTKVLKRSFLYAVAVIFCRARKEFGVYLQISLGGFFFSLSFHPSQ